MRKIIPLFHYCACGCGGIIKINKHLGRYAKYLKGHYKIIWTEKRKQTWSESRKGKNNPNFGNKGIKNSWFGKKATEETKKKISLATKGENNPRYGVQISEETKEKMRKSQLGIPISEETKKKLSLIFSGEGNPNWRNGSSFEPYSPIFNKETKERIKTRDNYQCQNPYCKHQSKILVIHHIDYNKQNCDDFNMITICNSCNSWANFNRDYWKGLYYSITYGEVENG